MAAGSREFLAQVADDDAEILDARYAVPIHYEPQQREKIPGYVEVADPAGQELEVYRATAARLDRSVRRLVPLL